MRLGDVAEVRDGFVDDRTVTRFNGWPAVLVRVDAAEEQSIVEMSEDVREWLGSYQTPEDVVIDVWSDSAKPALDRLTEIIRNGVIGALLVFMCLVLVFDLRVASWIAVGIPLSFIGSLIFFGPAGLTLNMGTVFAFFLLIGIVVDDAVVVGESIAAERETGKSALDAAISGANAVFGPILVGVVTTLAGPSTVRIHYIRRLSDSERIPIRRIVCLAGFAGGSVPDPSGATSRTNGPGVCPRSRICRNSCGAGWRIFARAWWFRPCHGLSRTLA